MNKKVKPWAEDIVEALKSIGGKGHYDEINPALKNIRGEENLPTNWEESIRGEIQRHSSDSKQFKTGNRDLFYSVNGIGKGVWGIRNYISDNKKLESATDSFESPEGKKKLEIHLKRERDPRIIKEAKKRFKEKHGRLFCEVCEFDFEKVYGEIGKDFIEGHHIKPVSKLTPDSITRIEDIMMVCSNCHRMLHRAIQMESL